MEWTLEVVVVPVSDVDRAKEFYERRLGFHADFDERPSERMRVVQLTPPGSGCSIVIGEGMVDMSPGSLQGLQLVVADVRAAQAELVERGVEVGGIQVAGSAGFRPLRDYDTLTGSELDNVGFLFFNDPDGNGWAVQQISARGQAS